METYRTRTLEPRGTREIGNWRVKLYTITHRQSFESANVLENAVARLTDWLSPPLAWPHHNHAFLIVHEGRDGVWSLVNWWVGNDMLRSLTFYTDYGKPDEFTPLQGAGFMACVWEIPIITFERAMWVEHVLKNAPRPDFDGYRRQFLDQPV